MPVPRAVRKKSVAPPVVLARMVLFRVTLAATLPSGLALSPTLKTAPPSALPPVPSPVPAETALWLKVALRAVRAPL